MTLPVYKPMLASRRTEPFDAEGWAFEVKLDGIRGLVYCEGGRVSIRSRSGRDISSHYPELTQGRLSRPCVIDGEIIAYGPDGNPSFDLLQHRMFPTSVPDATPVAFAAFDILYWDGEIVDRPLEERRAILDSVHLPAGWMRTEPVPTNGIALFEAVVDAGLEGIVGKRLASRYQPGRRSPDWVKVLHRTTIRAVVGGFSPGTGRRAHTFGSLALGLWDGEKLRYVGNVGSGFGDADVAAIAEALEQMVVEESPFESDPTIPAGTRYVVPSLVAHVEYARWTDDLHLRAPVFKGFGAEDHRSITWRDEGPSA